MYRKVRQQKRVEDLYKYVDRTDQNGRNHREFSGKSEFVFVSSINIMTTVFLQQIIFLRK